MISSEDKFQIQTLLAQASYGYDARDLDLLESCLTEDAQMSLCIAGGDLVGPFEGRDNIMQLYSSSMDAQSDVRKHVVSNIIIDDAESTDTLNVTSILTLFATQDGETRLLTVGFYRDQVTQSADGWRISKRHVDLDSAY